MDRDSMVCPCALPMDRGRISKFPVCHTIFVFLNFALSLDRVVRDTRSLFVWSPVCGGRAVCAASVCQIRRQSRKRAVTLVAPRSK